MNKPFSKNKLLAVLCLLASAGSTYWSINLGMERAMSGEPALLWVHGAAFVVAVALVVGAIVLGVRSER